MLKINVWHSPSELFIEYVGISIIYVILSFGIIALSQIIILLDYFILISSS